MRATCSALTATPHSVAADVQCFSANSRSPAFVALRLTIDKDAIEIHLAPDLYHAARDVADAWERLLDRAPKMFVSKEILDAL